MQWSRVNYERTFVSESIPLLCFYFILARYFLMLFLVIQSTVVAHKKYYNMTRKNEKHIHNHLDFSCLSYWGQDWINLSQNVAKRNANVNMDTRVIPTSKYICLLQLNLSNIKWVWKPPYRNKPRGSNNATGRSIVTDLLWSGFCRNFWTIVMETCDTTDNSLNL